MERKLLVYSRTPSATQPQEEPASSSSLLRPPITGETHEENSGRKRKRTRSQLHAYGAKKCLWKNFYGMFSGANHEDSSFKDVVEVKSAKGKSTSLRRLTSFFGHRKTQSSPIASPASAENTPNRSQGRFSETAADRSDDSSLVMVVKLPGDVGSDSVSLTMELEGAKVEEEPSAEFNMKEGELKELRRCKETEREVVFDGVIKVPPNTNIAKLANVPLYVMNSKEELSRMSNSEMAHRTIVRPCSDLGNETDSQIMVGDVRIKVRLQKPARNESKAKQDDSQEAAATADPGGSYQVLLLSSSFQLSRNLLGSEKEVVDSCGLEEKDSWSFSISESNKELAAAKDEPRARATTLDWFPERLPEAPAATAVVEEQRGWLTPGYVYAPSKKELQTIATQYSSTNFTRNVGVETQNSLIYLDPLEDYTNPSTSSAFWKVRDNVESPETASAETVWPQSRSTSTATEYSSTLLSYQSGPPYEDGAASLLAPSNSPSGYDTMTYTRNSKGFQAELAMASFDGLLRAETANVATSIEPSFDFPLEAKKSDTTLGLLNDARSKLETYAGKESRGEGVYNPLQSSYNLEGTWTSAPGTNTRIPQFKGEISSRFYEDDDEYYERSRRGDVRRYFQEEGPRAQASEGPKKNFRSGLSGDNGFHQAHPLTLDQNGNPNARGKLDYIKTKLDTELRNMQNLYKTVFDGMNRVLELDKGDEDGNKSKLKAMDMDLNDTFGELEACLSGMGQYLEGPSSSSPKEAIVNVTTESPGDGGEMASVEREYTYFTMEREIKYTIQELLNESENMKEVAILNGAKEESEPPFYVQLGRSPDGRDPYVFCFKIVDDIVTDSLKIVEAKEETGAVQEDVRTLLDALLDDVEDARKTAKGRARRTVRDFRIGDVNCDGDENEDDLQATKKKRTAYFCSASCLTPKVPKTSYSFGEGLSKRKRVARPESKSPARRRDGLNGHGKENARLMKELRDLKVFNVGEESKETSVGDHPSEADLAPNGIVIEADNHNGNGGDGRAESDGEDDPPKDPSKGPAGNPAPEMRKSAKCSELGGGLNKSPTTNLPSTSRSIEKETRTTEEEEELLMDVNLTRTDSIADESSDYFLPQKAPRKSASHPARKRAHESYDASTSEEELKSSACARRPPKKSRDSMEIVEIKSKTTIVSSSDTCPMVGLSRTNLDGEELTSGSSYVIGLRPAAATVDIQNRLNDHVEEPGRNPSVTRNPRRPLELLRHDHDLHADDSAAQAAETEEYDADLEGTVQLKMPNPKHRYKSIQELNSPEEVAAIEDNVEKNDKLERATTAVVLSPSDSYDFEYEEDSSTSIDSESKYELSEQNSSALINVIDMEGAPAASPSPNMQTETFRSFE